MTRSCSNWRRRAEARVCPYSAQKMNLKKIHIFKNIELTYCCLLRLVACDGRRKVGLGGTAGRKVPTVCDEQVDER
jgi:hypothetical protein